MKIKNLINVLLLILLIGVGYYIFKKRSVNSDPVLCRKEQIDRYISELKVTDQDMLNMFTEYLVGRHYESQYNDAEAKINLNEASFEELNELISYAQKCKNAYAQIREYNNKVAVFKATEVEFWQEKINYLSILQKKEIKNLENHNQDLTKVIEKVKQLATKCDSLGKHPNDIINKKGKYAYELNNVERTCPDVKLTVSQRDELITHWRKKFMNEIIERAGEKHREFLQTEFEKANR